MFFATVGLSVCRITPKKFSTMFVVDFDEIFGGVGCVTSNKRLDFWL